MFPPYTILYLQTVSIHLVLGETSRRNTSHQHNPGHLRRVDAGKDTPHPFDGIPGLPLLCRDGEVVGSLHPDNIDLLPVRGSKIECIIVSGCQTLTVGSALLERDGTEAVSRATFSRFYLVSGKMASPSGAASARFLLQL